MQGSEDSQIDPESVSHSSPLRRDGSPTWSSLWNGGYRSTENDVQVRPNQTPFDSQVDVRELNSRVKLLPCAVVRVRTSSQPSRSRLSFVPAELTSEILLPQLNLAPLPELSRVSREPVRLTQSSLVDALALSSGSPCVSFVSSGGRFVLDGGEEVFRVEGGGEGFEEFHLRKLEKQKSGVRGQRATGGNGGRGSRGTNLRLEGVPEEDAEVFGGREETCELEDLPEGRKASRRKGRRGVRGGCQLGRPSFETLRLARIRTGDLRGAGYVLL